MRASIFISCCLLLSVAGFGQRSPADRVTTSNGNITIQPILHSTFVLTWNEKTIYIDPYGGAKAFEGINPPNLVLITDIHGDHMHLETLQALDMRQATLVVPQAVAEKLPDDLKSNSVVLTNNSKTEQSGITILAVPMYNLPESPDSRHPKGRGNGYVLDIDGKRVYISGDTEDIPEMRALTQIDIAFVCMNQPFTMDIHQASSAVLEFKPRIVYPFHYRGQGGLSDVEGFKKLVTDGNPSIEVRLRNWYPAY